VARATDEGLENQGVERSVQQGVGRLRGHSFSPTVTQTIWAMTASTE
jgi:hypothetical protein